MSKIQIHLEFDSIADANRFMFLGAGGTPAAASPPTTIHDPTGAGAAAARTASVDAAAARAASPPAVITGPTGAGAAAAPAVSPSPQTAAANTAPTTIDENVMRAALNAYVDRGGGRTATTARELMKQYGSTDGGYKKIPPDRQAAFLAALNAA